MNKIEITRAAITKVTQMLAGQNIKVTQRGDQAFVAWNKKTRKIERVNIPYLPDNASEQLIAAVQGFLDHEVAHVLFTDPEARVDDKEPNAKRIDSLHNIVEDCWIEPKMIKAYRGTAVNLSNVRTLVFRDRVGKKADAAIAERGGLTEPEAVQHLLVVMMRALAGHEECIEYMDAGDKWAYFPTILPMIKPYYKEELDACETSWDTLALARRVFDDMQDSAPDEDDKGEECEDGTSDDKSGDEDSDEDKTDDADDGDDDSDEDKGGDEKSGKSSDSEEGEQEDEASGGKGDEETDEDPDETGEGSEGDEGDDEGESDKPSRTKEEADELAEALDKTEDFEKTAGDVMTDEYKKSIKETGRGWAIFTNDYDVVDTYPVSKYFVPQWFDEMRGNVADQIGPMQKQLERLLLSQKRSHYEPGRKNGRLNPAALHRLRTGDARVFRKKHITKTKDTAVQIVLDCSGSMSRGPGSRLATAFEAGYGLAMTLERCRIPCQVSGFTTKYMSSELMQEMEESERRLGIKYTTRRETNWQMIFKGWRERMTSQVSNRFADMRMDPQGRVCENIDPIAVEWAGRDLLKRPEERKVMMVLSDGFPAYTGEWDAGHQQLKKVVKQCEQAGIETIGIGIQTHSVGDFYPKNVSIRRIDQLGSVMMQEMRRILLR